MIESEFLVVQVNMSSSPQSAGEKGQAKTLCCGSSPVKKGEKRSPDPHSDGRLTAIPTELNSI